MDAIFRKWQNRYGISEEAYHALWGILSAIEHSSELELHDPVPHPEASQSQPPDISGHFPETWLFQEVVQGEEAVSSNIEDSFILQPNIESFIVGSSEVEQFDANLFVNGNTVGAASIYDVQPFPDDLYFLPRDTSIAAVHLPAGYPHDQNLPDENLSNRTQSTGYQHCSPIQTSSGPTVSPQKGKRSFTNRVTEDSTASCNKRRKSTKQCVRCWFSKRPVQTVSPK